MWLNQPIFSWYSYVTSFVITGEVPGMFCTEKFSIRWYAILQKYIIWFWITCTCTGTYYGNFNTVENTSRYEVYNIVHTCTHTAVDSILNFIIYATEKKIFLHGFFTDENQLLAVETGALAPLHHILTSCRSETLAAAAACLRNLSIHKLNEVCFLSI